MLHTLLFSLLAFTIFGLTLLWHRVRLGRMAEKVERLRMQVMR
jgi:hypothetical protein